MYIYSKYDGSFFIHRPQVRPPTYRCHEAIVAPIIALQVNGRSAGDTTSLKQHKINRNDCDLRLG